MVTSVELQTKIKRSNLRERCSNLKSSFIPGKIFWSLLMESTARVMAPRTWGYLMWVKNPKVKKLSRVVSFRFSISFVLSNLLKNIDWKKHSYCVDRQYSIGYKLVNRVGGRKGAGKGSQNSPAVGSTMALPDYIVCVRGLVSVELCLFRRRNSYTF